jgi:hypothetical protein
VTSGAGWARVLAGYDLPLYRDWLAWLGLVLTLAVTAVQVDRTGPWSLLSAPVTFALCGYLLGAIRNLGRGYRGSRAPNR